MTHEIQTLMLEYYELWGRMDAVYDRWAKAHGMTYTELMVLYALWETKQPITQRDLCQERHLPKQTVNSVLHALAKRPLVVFRESALDHRRKEIGGGRYRATENRIGDILTVNGMRDGLTPILAFLTLEMLEILRNRKC